METLLPVLTTCPLFRGIPAADLQKLLAQAHLALRDYAKDEVVGFEEDDCDAIGILAAGCIHIQRLYASGKSITIETLNAGDSFGEALVFADNGAYPATLIAAEDSRVIFLSKDDVLRLLSASPIFLRNFLRMLSNRILHLNRKIKGLSYSTVRQKVANYLLEEYQRQKSCRLKLPLARHELADALGIPRPSLSRELISLKDEGWIDFTRREINILDLEKLRQVLER